MDELKTCPICGSKLTIHGPEDWKPTFYDPDSGGDPYNAVCDCGFQFSIGYCEYDEFIKALNRRPAPENKPIDGIELAKIAVALQQLKAENTALKAKFDEVNRYNISCTKEIDRLLAEKVAPENKPLTLEQLRQMDGEPVWVCGIPGHEIKWTPGWRIIDGNRVALRQWNDAVMYLYFAGYGRTWLANARKPEQKVSK